MVKFSRFTSESLSLTTKSPAHRVACSKIPCFIFVFFVSVISHTPPISRSHCLCISRIPCSCPLLFQYYQPRKSWCSAEKQLHNFYPCPYHLSSSHLSTPVKLYCHFFSLQWFSATLGLKYNCLP